MFYYYFFSLPGAVSTSATKGGRVGDGKANGNSLDTRLKSGFSPCSDFTSTCCENKHTDIADKKNKTKKNYFGLYFITVN